MRYMGSKRVVYKHFRDTILKDLGKYSYYVEPFVGGFNSIIQVPKTVSIVASDVNYNLISLFQALALGWEPPSYVSEGMYYGVRDNQESYAPRLVGFVSFACSFGGKEWGGYARGLDSKGNPRNYALESKKALLKKDLTGMSIQCQDYKNLFIPRNSIIYCDPPYENTTKYRQSKFDYGYFWEWVRHYSKYNDCKVYVSGYTAPEDFEVIWEHTPKPASLTVNSRSDKLRTEKLFILKS